MRTVLLIAMTLAATPASAQIVLSCLGQDARFVLDDDSMVRTIAGVNVLGEPYVLKAHPVSFFFDTSTGRLWDGTIEQFFSITEPARSAQTLIAIHLGTEDEPVFNDTLTIRMWDENRFVHYKRQDNMITTGKCTVKD